MGVVEALVRRASKDGFGGTSGLRMSHVLISSKPALIAAEGAILEGRAWDRGAAVKVGHAWGRHTDLSQGPYRATQARSPHSPALRRDQTRHRASPTIGGQVALLALESPVDQPSMPDDTSVDVRTQGSV